MYITRHVSYLVRMSSEAMVRNASSTLAALLALVSKKGMPNDSAYSFAAALSTTLSSRSLLLPANRYVVVVDGGGGVAMVGVC